MTVYMAYGAPVNDAFVRHEVAVRVHDPVVFLDDGDRRLVAGTALEESTFSQREDVVDEFWSFDALGRDELLKDDSLNIDQVNAELALRTVTKAGVSSVVVPASFPLYVADHLRSNGVQVSADAEAWWRRRRRKTPWELEGVERAQRAAETAMLTASRMLHEAEPTAGGELRFEGEILTAEFLRDAMIQELSTQGADCEEILVQSGDACLDGHELGRGPILPDASCIIDCFPRDRRSGAYADMTRTFVPGTPSPELQRLYEHCRAALNVAFDALVPGSADAFKRVSDYFASQGFPTRLHYSGDGSLGEGFYHGLSHGVGLDVHERPTIGMRSEPVQEGDVVAVEPGLYFAGVGGVRLEDTVLITADGVVHLTDPFPYELTP